MGKEYDHAYDKKTCPKCGLAFCFSRCSGTNVHKGGKYEPDFMVCPNCGEDYFYKVVTLLNPDEAGFEIF